MSREIERRIERIEGCLGVNRETPVVEIVCFGDGEPPQFDEVGGRIVKYVSFASLKTIEAAK